MRLIGFSTGALAFGDFNRALGLLRGKATNAVELSALREPELLPLVHTIPRLDLSGFRYIAVHAPSRIDPSRESRVVELLQTVAERQWPIVVHPDSITEHALWRQFGNLLLVENMDKRKPIGRNVQELQLVFEKLPDAALCLDIGHARQVDPTMTEACLLLSAFGKKLRQIHLSYVNSVSKHDPLTLGAISSSQLVANLIPPEVPIILETVIQSCDIPSEIEKALDALTPVGAFATQ
jgi:hypothetical protein